MPEISPTKISVKLSMNKHRGFTLFELILVIFIMSLILMLVLPNLSSLTPAEEKKAALRKLTSLMVWTQNRAVIESENYALIFDFNKQEYRVRKRFIPEGEPEEDHVLFSHKLPENMKFKDVMIPSDTFDSEYFIINHHPNGMVEPYILHLELDDGSGEEKQIISVKVNPLTGEPKIYEGYRTWDDELKE